MAKALARFNLRRYDYWVFMTVLALLSVGLVTMFSASAPSSASKYDGDAYYIFRRQLAFALAGFAAMLGIAFVPYRFWGKASPLMLLLAFGLLCAVVAPGLAVLRKGTSRWLYLGPVSFQPSEAAKFCLICFLARCLARKDKQEMKTFSRGLLPYLLLVGAFVVLLMLEPHLSASIIVAAVAAVMLFAAGARLRHFLLAAGPVLAAAYYAVFHVERFAYMKERVYAFLDPWKDKADTGWQIINSLYAFASGGLFGRGIGKSLQKFSYIPEPQNDFIFPILGEELGFVGVALVLALFAVFVWRGLKIAIMAEDSFGSLLALGITSLVAVQALFNVAVVTAIVPVTGVSLPFFSYGGTSLMLFLGEAGVLLNISKSTAVDGALPPDQLLRAAREHMRAQQEAQAAKAAEA
jgi:cell division protein FtsW